MTSQVLTNDSVNFRPIRDSDFDPAIRLIENEVWATMTKSKLQLVCKEKLASFYVITNKNDDDEVLGVANVSQTRNNEAILGNVIVRKDLRGQGLGTHLLRTAIAYHDDVNVNWLSASDPFYEKLGYHKGVERACFVEMEMHREKVDQYCSENPMPEGLQITTLSDNRMDDLVLYDAGARGYQARKLLSLVIRTSDKVAVAVDGNDQSIMGYIAICKEDAGVLHFNGLFADDNSISMALLKHALGAFPGSTKSRFHTLLKRQFILQFGKPSLISNLTRFSTKRHPTPIPEEKVYCLSQPDIS